MTNKIDHSDLGKHPEVIKKAQKELLNMDVLVCGGCHAAFHFVKDFGDHKENCSGTVPKDHPEIKENWAFHLWKSSQANKDDENPWTLYKSWALLSKPQQLAWISAGQSLQSISRIGQGSVQETQVRVVRTVPDFKVSAVAGGVTKGPGIVTPTRVISTVSAEKKKEEASPATGGGDAGSKQHIVKRTMNVVGNRTEVRELPAERILSRRMNTKRNMYEYQVKWVNAALKNTWEPRTHFDKAPEMLEDCEMKLARAKLNMAGGAVTSASPVTPTSPGRPVRNSKSRAMDQVKQWCNTEEKGQALAAELKRKITDSDFAEAEDSSQDEGGSPKPKQFKASPQFEKKVVGGQVRYYQKSANGPLTPMNNPTADVRLATAADKQTGVLRKPGMVNKSPVKREAQVRVVGKNETTSSGIVRVAGSQLTSPQSSTPPPGTRMQKVIQTTRLPNGETVKRTVMRAVPITTPSPAVSKPGVTRSVVQASTIGRSPVQQFQAKRAATQPTVTYKVSPNGNANRVVRQQVTTPLVNRVVRTVPAAAATTPKAPAEDSEDMVLCPVTGKLISKSAADADGAELERLLTDDEKASQGGDGNTSAAEGEAGAGQDTQIQQLIENEDGSPVMVTGDDGTIYQVAGKNAEGQTLLIAQGAEGEQSCVFVAASEEAGGDQGGDSAQADGSGSSSGTASATSGDGATPGSQDGESGEEGAGGSQAMMVDQDSQDGQITAELVQADEPSADGTRRVVLLLPDGNLMVSEVNEEQYQQFNLGA